jgi:hypothetical protein
VLPDHCHELLCQLIGLLQVVARLGDLLQVVPLRLSEHPRLYITVAPANIWYSGNMRNLLEEIFYNIDQIREQADRERVWNVWNEVGGLTPSYDVIAMRLMRFTATSLLTIIDSISMYPEKVNLGAQRTDKL